MRVLVVTCECGERMKAPAWALGKRGVCPECGAKFRVTKNNTEGAPVQQSVRRRTGVSSGGFQDFAVARSSRKPEAPGQEAKERFARAVDLYFDKKYAQALAIFLSLSEDFPESPEIEQARAFCLKALQAPPPMLPAPERSRETDLARVSDVELNQSTVKKLILDKMLNSPSEMVQLRAAELASRLVGLDRTPADPVDEQETESTAGEEPPAAGEDPNGNTYPSVIEL
jgi:hypothetical protein